MLPSIIIAETAEFCVENSCGNYVRRSRIYYGMDKYYGCNIVESSVKKIERKKPEKRKRSLRPILAKCMVSLAVIGIIVAVHFISAEWITPVRDVLRAVFCYDAFGRQVGGSVIFGMYA